MALAKSCDLSLSELVRASLAQYGSPVSRPVGKLGTEVERVQKKTEKQMRVATKPLDPIIVHAAQRMSEHGLDVRIVVAGCGKGNPLKHQCEKCKAYRKSLYGA